MAILSNFQANGQEAIKVAPPTQSGTLTYTGSAQSPSWTEYPASVITITSTPQTNAGTYNATAALTAGHVWADTLKGGQRNIPWTINKHSGGVITLNKNAVELEYGESTTVTATLSSSSDTISASSSNSSIARVSVSGKTITITDGGTEGSATITVSASGNYTYTNATITVTVTHWEATVNITTTSTEFYNKSVAVTSVVLTNPTSVTFDSTGHATYKAHIIGIYNFAITYGGKTYQKEVNVTDETTYSIKLNKSWVLTVEINMANSDPETWATYKDDAVGMTAGSADWDEYFGHYPCVLNNGAELGKIKTSDFTKYENGSSIPKGLGNDVMIAFPRRGIKVAVNDNTLTVSMTDEDNASGFDYHAHTYKGARCDKFYLGAYKACWSTSKLYSKSGETLFTGDTLAQFRSYARARGTGYEQSGFFQLTFRQAMYMLKYKGQNAQKAIGRGYVDGNSAKTYPGGTNTRGMDWGETTGKQQMKLFGIEDFYGNIQEFIDGIYCNSSSVYTVSDGDFNDTGSGYTSTGIKAPQGGGYMQRPGAGTSGFAPALGYISGSETTYFCDSTNTYNNRLAIFGGGWAALSTAGVFRLFTSAPATYTDSSTGARLMYMHVES